MSSIRMLADQVGLPDAFGGEPCLAFELTADMVQIMDRLWTPDGPFVESFGSSNHNGRKAVQIVLGAGWAPPGSHSVGRLVLLTDANALVQPTITVYRAYDDQDSYQEAFELFSAPPVHDAVPAYAKDLRKGDKFTSQLLADWIEECEGNVPQGPDDMDHCVPEGVFTVLTPVIPTEVGDWRHVEDWAEVLKVDYTIIHGAPVRSEETPALSIKPAPQAGFKVHFVVQNDEGRFESDLLLLPTDVVYRQA